MLLIRATASDYTSKIALNKIITPKSEKIAQKQAKEIYSLKIHAMAGPPSVSVDQRDSVALLAVERPLLPGRGFYSPAPAKEGAKVREGNRGRHGEGSEGERGPALSRVPRAQPRDERISHDLAIL